MSNVKILHDVIFLQIIKKILQLNYFYYKTCNNITKMYYII